MRLESDGRIDEAVNLYWRANVLGGAQTDAVHGLMRIAKGLFADAIRVRDEGDVDGAIALLVRSLELNPRSGEVRSELDRLLEGRLPRDLTRECLIHPDAGRATQNYRNAFQLAIDFVLLNGVCGDIIEFGSLGGWTARHFAELARDSGFLGNLCLYDTFDGLPVAGNTVDQRSADLTRGVWRDNMRLPDSWAGEFGMSIDAHVAMALGFVISRSRIKIHKGFYSETVRDGVPYKAAIVHLDCDLYQSTVEALAGLRKQDSLQDGTILLFDDWNCNRGNPNYGQRRAFREFLEAETGRWSASPFHNYGHNCASFILHDLAV